MAGELSESEGDEQATDLSGGQRDQVTVVAGGPFFGLLVDGVFSCAGDGEVADREQGQVMWRGTRNAWPRGWRPEG